MRTIQVVSRSDQATVAGRHPDDPSIGLEVDSFPSRLRLQQSKEQGREE
jgi:hypothetical protein